jgi:hypothetical protein
MLLSNGKVVYFGPANMARQYFADLGYPCPKYTNPGDFFSKFETVKLLTIRSKADKL